MKIPMILNHLETMDCDQRMELLNFHSLSGLVFHRYIEAFPENKDQLKKEFIKHWKHNIEIDCILKQLSETKIKGELPILLKGAALLEDIYPELGTRPMCDIDILIKTEQLEDCQNWLKVAGFTSIDIETWKGDDFKYIFKKLTNNEQIIIEIHTRLFWHTEEELVSSTIKSKYSGFSKITLEENLIYLIGHLGFQHTLSKLSWFFDIYYLVELHQDEINWKKVKILADKMKLKSSLSMVTWILNNYFFSEEIIPVQFELKRSTQRILTVDFLWMDVRPRFDYYYIKHSLKDSMFEAIKYDVLWGLNKLKKIF
jgi:hypothetical protein